MLLQRTLDPLGSRRPQILSCLSQQIRHATKLSRPKRPYTFTQLVVLSDGSSFLHRTTSPAPVFKSSRDTRNSITWNPNSTELLRREEDEAGKLLRFRSRFGRAFDAESAPEVNTATAEATGDEVEKAEAKEEDNIMDLILEEKTEEEKPAGEDTDKKAGPAKANKKKKKGK